MRQDAPLWGVWKIEESADDLLSALEHKADYQPFLEILHTEKRRQEWLASRVLLKELLGREARIAYHPNGAPYLPDVPLHISVSHTKDYAAVLLQSQPFAGIDIEYRSPRVLKIRSRFMNEKEVAGIDFAHEIEYNLIHWCAKEALFKMIGQEGVDFCRHLHVEPFIYAESGSLTANETCTAQGATYTLHYRVTSDFVLVLSMA